MRIGTLKIRVLICAMITLFPPEIAIFYKALDYARRIFLNETGNIPKIYLTLRICKRNDIVKLCTSIIVFSWVLFQNSYI